MNTDEFLTVKKVDSVLAVNPITIDEYIRLKKIRSIKIERYYRIHPLTLIGF